MDAGDGDTHDLLARVFKVKTAFVKGDVTKEAIWEEIVKTALDVTGRIDM